MMLAATTKRVGRALARLQARFWCDRRGGIAIFTAAAMIPLIGALGLATDVARSFLVKSRLQDAVDAAALAGGKVIASASRDTDINAYFRANFPSGYMAAENPSAAGTDPVPVITDNHTGSTAATTVTVTANAKIPTTFMRVLGFQDITVSALATATHQVAALDVVLAMDISGSMGQPISKMNDAKTAATNLVEYLFNNGTVSPQTTVGGTTYDLLHIGLVPWNESVNVTRNGVAFTGLAAGSPVTVPSFTNPMTGLAQTQIWYANNSPVPLLNDPRCIDWNPANYGTTCTGSGRLSTWSGAAYMRYSPDGNNTNDGDFVLGTATVGGASWQGFLAANDYWSKARTSGTWPSGLCVGEYLSIGGSSPCAYPTPSGGTAYASAGTASNAFDGNTGTRTSSGTNGWVGYGLPSGTTAAYRLIGIRNNSTRTLNLQFQTDSSSTFSSPTTVYTVPNLAVTAGVMTYVRIPTPYTGERYFRVIETGGSTFSPQELIFSTTGYSSAAPEEVLWQGADKKCYWRYWQSSDFVNTDLPIDAYELPDRPPYATRFDYAGSANDAGTINGNGTDCDDPPAQGITDLTPTKATIESAINGLSPAGHTDIPAGLYWAWEVVTPGGPFNGALASPPFPRAQAIVLFTDGENQSTYGDGYMMSFGYDTAGATATTYGDLPADTDGTVRKNNMNNRLIHMADAIKAAGVRIYIVKYQHSDASTTTLLQTVASGTGAPYYFDAADYTQLNDAFQQIAADLSKLRLSQ
jgi:Flp pilus assembly protein TadG